MLIKSSNTRSLVTRRPAVGGTAAVMQAMLLRRCFINSLPHYLQVCCMACQDMAAAAT
jgi:hypothetical protein